MIRYDEYGGRYGTTATERRAGRLARHVSNLGQIYRHDPNIDNYERASVAIDRVEQLTLLRGWDFVFLWNAIGTEWERLEPPTC